MNSPSKGEINRLGERLRAPKVDSRDFELLDQYRRGFGRAIFGAHDEICVLLNKLTLPCILTGRLKRTKSIIRKLVREPGMKLARMTDIGGLRLIVGSLDEQTEVTAALTGMIDNSKIRDYTGDNGAYRAFHITGTFNALPVEVQIRTLPQQLWANESESFGEQVKEGGGLPVQRDYLERLSKDCFQIESGTGVTRVEACDEIGMKRKPFSYRLEWLKRQYQLALSPDRTDQFIKIISFDSRSATIANQIDFVITNKEAALDHFEFATSRVNADRFDVLLFNSTTDAVLKVTHFRYYLN